MEEQKREHQDSMVPEKTTEEIEELAVYEKLRLRVSKMLGELQEKVNKDTIAQSMEKATNELKDVGEHSKEIIGKAKDAMNKDIATSSKYISNVSGDAKKHLDDWADKGGAFWNEIGKEVEYVMDLSRDKGGAFLLNMVNAVSGWSQNLGKSLDESLTYKTGENYPWRRI